MDLLTRLLGKTPGTQDVRQQLKDIELNRKKRGRDLALLEQSKQERLRRAVEAKKSGRRDLLRDYYRELSQIEIDIGYTQNDLRRLSLARIALNAFLTRLTMLEQKRDRKGLQYLITRFRDSSVQSAIDKAAVDDDTFGHMLDEILGEQIPVARGDEIEERGWEVFDRTIGDMVTAEQTSAVGQSSPERRSSSRKQPAGPRHSEAFPAYGPRWGETADELRQKAWSLEQQIAYLKQEADQLRAQITTNADRVAQMSAQAAALSGNPETASEGAEAWAQVRAMEAALETMRRDLQIKENQVSEKEAEYREIMKLIDAAK